MTAALVDGPRALRHLDPAMPRRPPAPVPAAASAPVRTIADGLPRPGPRQHARTRSFNPAHPLASVPFRCRSSAPSKAWPPGQGPTSPWPATSCIAAQSARFLQAFIRIGLLPDAGGTWTVATSGRPCPRRAPWPCSANPSPLAQAEAWGLIWRAVPDEDLIPEAERKLAAPSGRPPHPGHPPSSSKPSNASDGNTLGRSNSTSNATCNAEAGAHPRLQRRRRRRSWKNARPAFTGRPRMTDAAQHARHRLV